MLASASSAPSARIANAEGGDAEHRLAAVGVGDREADTRLVEQLQGADPVARRVGDRRGEPFRVAADPKGVHVGHDVPVAVRQRTQLHGAGRRGGVERAAVIGRERLADRRARAVEEGDLGGGQRPVAGRNVRAALAHPRHPVIGVEHACGDLTHLAGVRNDQRAREARVVVRGAAAATAAAAGGQGDRGAEGQARDSGRTRVVVAVGHGCPRSFIGCRSVRKDGDRLSSAHARLARANGRARAAKEADSALFGLLRT